MGWQSYEDPMLSSGFAEVRVSFCDPSLRSLAAMDEWECAVGYKTQLRITTQVFTNKKKKFIPDAAPFRTISSGFHKPICSEVGKNACWRSLNLLKKCSFALSLENH